jgi:xylulokinase
MGVKYLIGIDLGTTLAKCVIYDEAGKAAAEAQREMEIVYPEAGQAEQDASSFYTIACVLIKKCVSESGIDVRNIAAIGIDSQMGGIMSVDRNFDPVTYYDTPLDSRSAEENRYMHENFGDLILKKSGSLSTYGNKILYWKKRNEWRDIHKFIQPSAFVAGKLAGLSGEDAYIDESFICFSGLCDLENSDWSDELCSKLEVGQKKLPKIVKSTEIIGELTSSASAQTGLPKGVPICAGCGDQAAGFVGAGILAPGQMVDVSGTACVLAANVDRYTYDRKHMTAACLKSAIGDNYYLLSVVLGGRTHKWFVDEFFGEERERVGKDGGDIYGYLDEKASLLPPGSDGLVAVDYLQGRFFPPDPDVRGLFIGHTWAHKRIHFYRSILESIAYDHYITKGIIQELVPEVDLKTVTAIGSGAGSRLWMQIKADVLQVPYQNLFRSDLSTLGSAVIAGHSIGLYKDIEATVKKIVKSNVKVEPVPGEDKKYQKYIDVYRELFGVLKETYGKLAD